VVGRPVRRGSLRAGQELRRQAHSPADGRQLRVVLPAFDISRADHGGGTFEVRRWAGVGVTTPVLLNHDGPAVADVIGWQRRTNDDLAVWVQLRPDQHDLQVRALWGELAASPRFRSVGDEWNRLHRHAVVGAAHITELSLVPADENRLPGCGVTCEPCPAHARHDAAPADTTGNYAYRDRTGMLIHVRTYPTRFVVS
jgi:hypothetical protein